MGCADGLMATPWVPLRRSGQWRKFRGRHRCAGL